MDVGAEEYVELLKYVHEHELGKLQVELMKTYRKLQKMYSKLPYCRSCGNQKDGPFIAFDLHGTGQCGQCGVKFMVARREED